MVASSTRVAVSEEMNELQRDGAIQTRNRRIILKSTLDSLLASRDLERVGGGGPPKPTDPLLALWVRERMNDR
jgi:hypothetical protein